MPKIIKYKAGDEVYFLSGSGYKQGWVNTVFLRQEFAKKIGTSETFIYYVTCKDYSSDYQGDSKQEHELFETKEQMLAHYALQFTS